jgi:hypothetical protein
MIVFICDKEGLWHATKEKSADKVSNGDKVKILCKKKSKEAFFSAEEESVLAFTFRYEKFFGVRPRVCDKCCSIVLNGK